MARNGSQAVCPAHLLPHLSEENEADLFRLFLLTFDLIRKRVRRKAEFRSQ
jgi:hypothetical protein